MIVRGGIRRGFNRCCRSRMRRKLWTIDEGLLVCRRGRRRLHTRFDVSNRESHQGLNNSRSRCRVRIHHGAMRICQLEPQRTWL